MRQRARSAKRRRCRECEAPKCKLIELTDDVRASETIDSTRRGAVRVNSRSGEHKFPEPLRVVVVQV